jgi:hypothetical protein
MVAETAAREGLDMDTFRAEAHRVGERVLARAKVAAPARG